MRDGFLIQTLPFFSGALAFLPGCSPSPSNDDTTDTSSPTTTSPEDTSAGPSTTEDPTTTTDDPTTSTSPTTMTMTTMVDSSETGDPACGGGTCGSPVEDGWFGPTVYARLQPDAPLPSCTPDYPDQGPTLLDGFTDPGPAFCDCSCELTQQPNCQPSMAIYSTQNCGNWINNVAVSAACSNINIPAAARVSAYGYQQGMCEEEDIEEIPPVAWDATIKTCRVSDAALACGDDGVCLPPLPEGFEDNWCMYRQGDHECPAGPYSNKSIFWSGAEDTRACSNCQCGSAGATCNDVQVMVFAGADCEGVPAATIDVNTCSNVVGNSVAQVVEGNAVCPVTEDSAPMGGVAAMGEFTFCCAN